MQGTHPDTRPNWPQGPAHRGVHIAKKYMLYVHWRPDFLATFRTHVDSVDPRGGGGCLVEPGNGDGWQPYSAT